MVLAIAAAGALGLAIGHTGKVLALALAAIVFVQARNLVRLDRWLGHRDSEPPPDLTGLWGEVVAAASRIHRRKLYHEHRVSMLLREFRRMAEAMPDGVVLLSKHREILWFNGAAGEWLRLERGQDRGVRVDNLVRHPLVVDYLADPASHPAPRVRLGGSEDRWLEFHLVRNDAGEQQLLLVRDVTTEVRLDTLRKDFVANASHELRSPLTVIGGYLDALEEDPSLDPAWHEPVQEMRRQSDRMRRIVQDLLELSRLEAQSGPAERATVDMAGLVATIRKEVLARPGSAAVIDIDADARAVLYGSEGEIDSAVSNLVWNAVKYTPADGHIRVRWWADARGGHLSVADTGIGIAAEHLPRLTERFYRVDAGRSRKLGGSGLGLSIVKHALQRHEGRLEVESVEGQGSTFTCHFPATRVGRAADGDEAAATGA
jgi:two-component system phosphate regulon sensor histidine kinase PhoR